MKSGKDTQPKRLCKTATLGSSFGLGDNLKEAVSSAHLGRIAFQSRLEKSSFRRLGNVGGLEIKKRKHLRASLATAKVIHKKRKCKLMAKKPYNVYALYVACRLSATLLREPSLIGGGRLIAVLFRSAGKHIRNGEGGKKMSERVYFCPFRPFFPSEVLLRIV